MAKVKKPITDWDKFRKSFLKNNLRRATWMWPANREVIVAARTERRVNPATGHLCWHVKCADCKQEFLEKEVEVDHVNPIVNVQSVQGFTANTSSALDMGHAVLRMFPDPSGLQVLCQRCHATKTSNENTARREIRRIVSSLQPGQGSGRPKGRRRQADVEPPALEGHGGASEGSNLRGKKVRP